MAYLLENNPNVNEDIITRKEFYQYYLPDKQNVSNGYDESIIPRFLIEKMISTGNYLQFHSYQLFVANFINPNTPYSRLLMKWQTGTGKTIGALAVALNFIRYFRSEETNNSSSIGSVFVLGFTAQIFRNELLRFPEFGIISREELHKLKKLRALAYAGSSFDIEKYQEYLMRIKKKFNNRQNNGFFRFIGYKKLVNMVFKIQDSSINISNLDEDGISQAIADKKILLDIPFLDEFKNSILICDEIHNVYNSLDKNNWGVALQYILNYHPSVRALFMSATPINNSPTEIIDLLNLILPTQYYTKLNKKDFFDVDRNLKKGALEKIANFCKGRISYLRDSNPLYFPTKQFIGEYLPGAPYLKFIRCPMSEFHYNTYKEVYTGSLSPESQYLTDFALPNPDNSKIGMYQTSVVKKMLSYADQNWKDANKIDFRKGKIIGDILRLKNLPHISTKFASMMETINSIINNQCGKIFIYHNIIHMSGVLFIQEILLQNYIIGECDSSTANTICAICGKMRKDHSKEQTETFAIGGSNHGELSHNNILKTIIDETYHIKNNGKQLIIQYNKNLLSYEVFAENNKPAILEFMIIDNIVVVRGLFADLTNNIVLSILKVLSANHKLLIQSKKSSILKNINLYIFYTNREFEESIDTDDTIYYANAELKQTDIKYRKNLMKVIKKTLNNHSTSPSLSLVTGGKSKNQKKSKKIKKNQNSQPNKQPDTDTHTYMPVRFMAVHSELDKSSINNSLNKYNSPDNDNGCRIMILVGGKLIKEAYDIKAVRELMIMGRPDNIPTLIQIVGRAVRKNSHKYLIASKKNVNIRIFTSCLPIKKKINGKMVYELGYEEIKYVEKLQHYKIIQNIEKTLHENAIDAYMNRNIIWSKKEQKNHEKSNSSEELGALYFKPSISNHMKKTFKISELNLQTFDAFHKTDTINNIVIIIKRLFLEKSPVWKYDDLYKMVLNSRNIIMVEFNTSLIDEELFIVALTRLVWANNNKYVEPIINARITNHMIGINNVIDKLFDTDDKIIILPGNQKSVITQVGDFYMLFPLDDINNEPLKIMELPYRIIHTKESVDVYIKSFLESGQTLSNYSDKRDRFFTKWNNVSIEKLEMAVCDFGTDFHVSFLEECIKYIFNVWTDPTLKKSFMHVFYFKMLNYYDLRRLVVWGHILKPYLFTKYSKYLNQIDVKLKQKKTKLVENKLEELDVKEKNMSTSGLINFLKSSINKSDLHWVSNGLKKQFNENLDKSLKLFDGNYKKNTRNNVNKVNADLVPVGHFLSPIPKFYHPNDKWFESPEYLNTNSIFVENNTIVGYDERSKTGVHIRFKIRTPIQNIKQFKDSRLIEKGSVCSSKSKVYLREIAQKIGIKFKEKENSNVTSICNSIRTKLIYLELKERIANTKIKYFYFIYEKRPETIK
jgi:hypothetical protein